MADILGQHLLAEFYGCDTAVINDEAQLMSACQQAAELMGATVVGKHSHHFQPHGISVVIILAESHLSLHTWPEHAVASLDVFTCGNSIQPQAAKQHLSNCLGVERVVELQVQRGGLAQARSLEWKESLAWSGR